MVLPVKSNRFLIFTRPFNRLESAWVNVHVIVRLLSNVREKVEWPHGSGDPVLVANRFFLCLHVHLSIHAFLDCLLDLSFSPLSSRLLSAVQIRHTVVITFILDDSCRLRALPGSVSRLRVTTCPVFRSLSAMHRVESFQCYDDYRMVVSSQECW